MLLDSESRRVKRRVSAQEGVSDYTTGCDMQRRNGHSRCESRLDRTQGVEVVGKVVQGGFLMRPPTYSRVYRDVSRLHGSRCGKITGFTTAAAHGRGARGRVMTGVRGIVPPLDSDQWISWGCMMRLRFVGAALRQYYGVGAGR